MRPQLMLLPSALFHARHGSFSACCEASVLDMSVLVLLQTPAEALRVIAGDPV